MAQAFHSIIVGGEDEDEWHKTESVMALKKK